MFSIAEDHGFSATDIKCDMMVKWLYEELLKKQYTTGWHTAEGVVLKKARGSFTCYPRRLSESATGLYAMVTEMNIRVGVPEAFSQSLD